MISSAPRFVLAASLLLTSTVALGCSDLGTHSLAIEGSTAVASGVGTVDEWTISFDEFVVVVHNPGLIERTNNKPTWVRESGVSVWDVTQALEEGEELSRQIRATVYDGVDYRIAPASASGYEAMAGNVDTAVVEAAVEDDWSIHVVGSATNPTTMQTITFDWTFATNTFYRCKLDTTQFVELGADGDETTVLEIYGESLFRVSGDGQNGDFGFDAIAAADANDDGAVTKDELADAGVLDGIEALSQELGGYRGSGYGACLVVDE
jgi:hypothetical protein